MRLSSFCNLLTPAPVASHRVITWSWYAVLKILTQADSSDQTLVVTIFSRGIQFAYISTSDWTASSPLGVVLPPISTLSDLNRSSIAVPSAKNSGLDNTSKDAPCGDCSNMVWMALAVRTGRVLFSTTILSLVATLAIRRAWKICSHALPLP